MYNVNQTLTILTISMFFYYGNHNINCYDIYSRVLGNEFYINLYYFLWTSFWYIPLLILLIVIWQFINYTSIKHILIVATALLLLFNVGLDIHMYWTLNTNPYSIPLKSDYYNNLLLNSINKYHPGLLYWSSLLIIVYWISFNLHYLNVFYRFYITSTELMIVRSFLWFGPTLLTTLGLGGWWALQEGSWGGWWNWDPSEVFGLAIALFYLLYTHNRLSKQNFLNKWYWSLNIILLLLQIYFFTQLNFDLVSHNFGTKIDNFIDNTNLYTSIILISYTWLLYLWYQNQNIVKVLLSSQDIFNLKPVKLFRIYVVVITCIFFYEFIYSLIPLFNDFLWKLFSINIANSILIFEKYNLQIIYLTLLFFWQYHQTLALFLVYTTSSYWVLLVLYLVPTRKVTLVLHLFISFFMWLGLLTFGYVFTEWSFHSLPNLNVTNILYTYINQTLLNTNSMSLDYTQIQYMSGEFWLSWNTIWVDTTPEVYSFIYYLTQDISTQAMIIGSKLFNFSININDILSCNLPLVFILLISLYLYSFYSSKKIMF